MRRAGCSAVHSIAANVLGNRAVTPLVGDKLKGLLMHARIRTLAVLPSLTILLAAGAGSFAAFADDVLAQFKQTPAKAQEAVMSAVWAGGQPYIDGSWVIFRGLSPEARASAVRAAADFARAYASSDAFKKQYAANRTSQAPKPP